MEWLLLIRDEIGQSGLQGLGWLVGFAVVLGLLARLTPCNPGMYGWKNLTAVGTDLVYWFIVPLFLRVGRTLMLIAGLVLLYRGAAPQFLPVQNWPLGLQCLAVLFLQDIQLYWTHRLFHTRWAWRFHAIHHSPKLLDWLALVRFHPVNHLLAFGLADVTVVLLGFSPEVLFALAPLSIIHAALVHANLNWTFGPLRYVIASPVFHRWHHTQEGEGLDTNFASTFPFLDLMFGTFYMPPGKLPQEFGNGDPAFPEDFLGQLLYPIRRVSTEVANASPSPGEAGWARRGLVPFVWKTAGVVALLGLLGGGLYLTERPPTPPIGATCKTPAGQEQPLTLPAQAFAENKTAILGVAISPDGRVIITAGEDGLIKIWDADTGRVTRTLTGHGGAVHGVALSADGKRLVSGSSDKTVKIWDTRTGRLENTLVGHRNAVLGVAVSADGRWVASCSSDRTVRLWDAVTGQQTPLQPDEGAITGVALLSGDGQCLVSSSLATAKVWHGPTHREQLPLQGHTDLVYTVAVSTDGTRIATGSYDGTVKVWEAASGQEWLTLRGHTGPVFSVALGPAGKLIASGGGDNQVRIWDGATGRQKFALQGHKDAVTAVAITADGRRVVSAGRDGSIQVWDAQTGALCKIGAVSPHD